MTGFLKYGVVPIIIFLFLFIATVLVLPVLINVQKFVPEIEKKVSAATGRSFSLGQDFRLSFFPRLSVSSTGMKLGNPEGFQSNEFLEVGSLEAQIKVLPLFKKELQFSNIDAGGVKFTFGKNGDGKANWNFSVPSSQRESLFLSGDFSIDHLKVSDGTATWNNSTLDSNSKVEKLNLVLKNVKPDTPIRVELTGELDNQPLALEGDIASFGKDNNLEGLAVDLDVTFSHKLKGHLKGNIVSLKNNPGYDLAVRVAPFSPRELFKDLNVVLPATPSDPEALGAFELQMDVNGNQEQLTIDKGVAKLDGSQIDFSLVATDLNRPDLGFTLAVDSLDLDRYLPSVEGGQDSPGKEMQEQIDRDYSALRSMSLAGTLQCGELKLAGGTVGSLKAQVKGGKGIINISPATFTLYQGQGNATLIADFQRDLPNLNMYSHLENVKIEPLLHDFMNMDFLTGMANIDLTLQFSGDSKQAILKSTGGKADLQIQDGVLKGIDLAGLAGGDTDVLTAADASGQAPMTVFSELKSNIAIENGLLETRETIITSPLLQSQVSGTADLVSQQLDVQFVPESDTMKTGQGSDERTEVFVTSVVTGPFNNLQWTVDGSIIKKTKPKTADSGRGQILADEKLPSTDKSNIKKPTGKQIVKPTVAANRIRLQPKVIQKSQDKKPFIKQPVTEKGNIQIRPLQQASAMQE